MCNKKVLFSATVYSHLNAFHKPFIKMLQRKGYKVHALACSKEGGKKEIQSLGVKCWDISFSRNPYHLDNIKVLTQLRKVFKNNYYELIHVHTPIASFLVRLAARIYNQGSVLYTAHGFHFFKGASLKNWLIYYPVERIASSWTDGLIVINKEDFKVGKRMGLNPKENLFYINGIGVDLNKYKKTSDWEKDRNQISKELGIKDKEIIITCVAEFTKNKNHLFLLQAWEKLINRFDNIHLLLVGKGDEKKYIEEVVENKGINNVHFLGFRKDIPKIFRASDIITLVSKREGLPRSIMEAMACSKPVIVSNVRGSRDLVQDDKNGFIIDLNNVEQLINRMEDLIKNKKKRLKMGKEGRKRIISYSLDNVISQMEEIYDKFLEL